VENKSFVIFHSDLKEMAAIVLGCGMTSMGRLGQTATMLMQRALERALGDARVALHDVKGLIAVPSLAEPRFMHAHFLATRVGLLPATEVLVRTIGDFSFLRPFFFFSCLFQTLAVPDLFLDCWKLLA
jgi:hypothetical protein